MAFGVRGLQLKNLSEISAKNPKDILVSFLDVFAANFELLLSALSVLPPLMALIDSLLLLSNAFILLFILSPNAICMAMAQRELFRRSKWLIEVLSLEILCVPSVCRRSSIRPVRVKYPLVMVVWCDVALFCGPRNYGNWPVPRQTPFYGLQFKARTM